MRRRHSESGPNSPYEEPKRHFVFDKDGITDQIAETRRLSSYFLPIPRHRRRAARRRPGELGWGEDRDELTS